jgi:hypothetical protein
MLLADELEERQIAVIVPHASEAQALPWGRSSCQTSTQKRRRKKKRSETMEGRQLVTCR